MPRTSNTKRSSGPVNTNWGSRPVNTKLGARACKYKLQTRAGGRDRGSRPGLGAKQRARGRETQRPQIYLFFHRNIFKLLKIILKVNENILLPIIIECFAGLYSIGKDMRQNELKTSTFLLNFPRQDFLENELLFEKNRILTRPNNASLVKWYKDFNLEKGLLFKIGIKFFLSNQKSSSLLSF